MAQELTALRAENASLLRLLKLTWAQAAPTGPVRAVTLTVRPASCR